MQKEQKDKEQKEVKGKEEKGKVEAEKEEKILRIGDVDIPVTMKIYRGLMKIHGISYSLASAIVNLLDIRDKKFEELDEQTLNKLIDVVYNPKKYLPSWLLNYRRFDEKEHHIGDELRSVDQIHIEEIKNSGTWRGFRHQFNYKVRGQRTRSRGANVRGRVGQTVGVMRKAKQMQQSEKKE